MTVKRKQEIISFKADESLLEALRGIPNRSDFIRSAILAALDSACPLCKGTGILSPEQRRHWESFAVNHSFRECVDCHAVHLVCRVEARRPAAHKRARRRREKSDE